MIKSANSFFFLLVLNVGISMAQKNQSGNTLEKGKFFVDFGVELQHRDFAEDTYLGDTYQIDLGYRISINMGLVGYPGLGWYGESQNARILDNRFLAGYFSEAVLGDAGIFIFHSIPLGKRIVIRPELGFGNFRAIHGISPSRFILNYGRFFGKLGIQYPIVKISENFSLSFSLNASYSLYNGNGIVINPEDQQYIRRSNGFQLASGILLKIH
ncbi:hypothetical protein [Algoriphagus litoralis]|uniref:hypothetical protein n=1 Tax=Algoriphagus litoralis TaxID=2202829 RepID=UPI0013009D36|nr:hypothetical protein [Algoriphagus litoralis]